MRKLVTALATAATAATGTAVVSPATAVPDPQNHLVRGCSWSFSHTQRCKVPSPSMGRTIDVDIRPAKTQGNPKVVQFLDGVGNPKPSGWITAGKALRHLDQTDATLVFPYPPGGSWYADYDRPGADGKKHLYTTFMTKELPAFLEREFSVPGGGVGHTGVAGISAGGFGALSLASQRPDMYRHVIAMSGVYDPGMPFQRLIVDGSSLVQNPGAGHGPWVSERNRAKANPTVNINRLTMPVDVTVASGLHNFFPRERGPEHPLASIFVGGPFEVGNVFFTGEFVANAKARGNHNIRPFYDPVGTHSWDTWRRNSWDRGMVPAMIRGL